MYKNSFPKVSIIIPCYNQAQYVSDAIESALNQTYKNLEIVCINDASTDNSAEIIKQYAYKHDNLVFLDEVVNSGVCAVRNRAIEVSSGEYILPLDADDKIEPDYVEKAAEILKTNPKIGIVYCLADLFGIVNKPWELEQFDKNRIIFNNQIFNSALFRKSDFNSIGGYKSYMKDGLEDWDLWLSFVEKGFEAYRIEDILFHYRKLETKTRTDNTLQNNSLYTEIIKHHLNLFLENDLFYERLSAKGLEQIKPLEQKVEKYKKRYTYFFIVIIFETIVILGFLINFILRVL